MIQKLVGYTKVLGLDLTVDVVYAVAKVKKVEVMTIDCRKVPKNVINLSTETKRIHFPDMAAMARALREYDEALEVINRAAAEQPAAPDIVDWLWANGIVQ